MRSKKQKSLGQVAYEAHFKPGKWHKAKISHARWGTIARAVECEVLKRARKGKQATLRTIVAGQAVWIHRPSNEKPERVFVSRVTKDAIFIGAKSCGFNRAGLEIGRRGERWITIK